MFPSTASKMAATSVCDAMDTVNQVLWCQNMETLAHAVTANLKSTYSGDLNYSDCHTEAE